MSKEAELSDVEAALSVWTPGQQLCRGYSNHHWDPYGVLHDRRLHYLRITQVCRRCSTPDKPTTRWREYTERMRPLSGWVSTTSENYAMPKGTGRVNAEGRGRILMETLTEYRNAEAITSTKVSRENPPRSGATRRALGVQS